MRRIFFTAALFSLLAAAVVLAQVEETKTVVLGDTMAVTLDTPNPDYHWEVDEQPDVRLALMDTQKTADGEVWTFKALGYGMVTLTFNYVNPEEKDGPAKKIIYHVTVAKKE